MEVNKDVLETNFLKNLKAFLKDLILVFPEDRDVKVISSSLNIAMVDDPKHEIIKGFYASLVSSEQLILSRKDEFFYQDAYIFTAGGTINAKYQHQLFSKLNFYWENMNNQNRLIVWDYMQLLYKLAAAFHS